MKFNSQIKDFKQKIDKQLEKSLDGCIADAAKKDKYVADALKHVKKITLAGGKRIRPALLYYSYLSVGGKEKAKIMKVCAAMELVHMFFLVHDDIIDRGKIRHSIATVNAEYEKIGRKNFAESDANHFGNSVAVVIGDFILSMASKMICQAGFEEKITLKALEKLQAIIETTIIGQSQDMYIEYRKDANEKMVLNMYENKTARYTFEGPLHLGLIFAGNGEKKLFDCFSRYALNLGIAFQIQDDLIGLFANEKKAGKSASDVIEGKRTLLVVKAIENSSKAEKAKIKKILGNPKATKKEIEEFQKIIENSGSKKYAEDFAKKYFTKGKNEIENLIIRKEAKQFLLGMIAYLEKRDI